MSRNTNLPRSSAASLSDVFNPSIMVSMRMSSNQASIDGSRDECESLNLSRFGFGFWDCRVVVPEVSTGVARRSESVNSSSSGFGFLGVSLKRKEGVPMEMSVMGVLTRRDFDVVRVRRTTSITSMPNEAVQRSPPAIIFTNAKLAHDAFPSRLKVRFRRRTTCASTRTETWIPWMPSPGRLESGGKKSCIDIRCNFAPGSAHYDSLRNAEAAAPPPDTRPTTSTEIPYAMDVLSHLGEEAAAPPP
ncbi:hypothetical protein BDZ89DRAFT_1208265 [Hymenopellis radicata]|nr:hypothetical protein BDZ89DRAFT_1208265 [Hymenopellis radicata]